MECWKCAETAAGTCRFCGRGVCRGHAQTMPYVLTAWSQQQSAVEALVIEDSISCGMCNPHPMPVRLDQLLSRLSTGGRGG